MCNTCSENDQIDLWNASIGMKVEFPIISEYSG